MARKQTGQPQNSTNAAATATITPTPTFPSESPSTSNGNGEKKRPTYKVGPILTDRSSAVECEVWESEVAMAGGQTTRVHQVIVQAFYRDAEGTWKSVTHFRGSQLYVLLYCLQRASDFILSQRDPANDCPF